MKYGLSILVKPSRPMFDKDILGTGENKQLVVSCTSTGSRPVATIQWMLGHKISISSSPLQVTMDTAKDTYTVNSTLVHTVNRSDNGKTVTCRANNLFTSSTSSKIINVKCKLFILIKLQKSH